MSEEETHLDVNVLVGNKVALAGERVIVVVGLWVARVLTLLVVGSCEQVEKKEASAARRRFRRDICKEGQGDGLRILMAMSVSRDSGMTPAFTASTREPSKKFPAQPPSPVPLGCQTSEENELLSRW
jgi:hypothetical protein